MANGQFQSQFLRLIIAALFTAGVLCAEATEATDAADVAQAEKAAVSNTKVVFLYPKVARSITRTDYPILILANADTDAELRLHRETGMQVVDAIPGRYYIKQIETGLFSFASLPLPRPESDEKLLPISADSVVYIGDITWSTGTGLRMDFSKGSLLELQDMKTLHDKPLMLASFGRPAQEVSWD